MSRGSSPVSVFQMQNLVLRGRVFDGSKLHDRATVIIDAEKGSISSFGEQGSVEAPKDSKALEMEGTTILPGLIDAHVHFFGSRHEGIMDWATTPGALAALRSVRDLNLLLRAGFTTVRELGSKEANHISRAAAEGAFPSPRIISCSRALAQTGGDDDPNSLPLEIAQALASYSYFCDGPWECRQAVRKVVRDGGQVVKIYSSGGFSQGGKVRLQFTLEEIRAIADEAHRSGLSVAAHAYGEEAIMNSIEGGADSIEHGLGLTVKAAQAIKERGLYYIPTLVTYAKGRQTNNPFREEMVRKHLSEDMEIAKKHNLKVVMGSDIVGDAARPHGRNYEEIVAEARFLGNQEALVAATSRAAECLNLPTVGRIAPGFDADLVVVRGNPLENIEALSPENVVTVVRSGRII